MTGLGLLAAIINYEYDAINFKEVIDINKYPNAMLHPRNQHMLGIFCKNIILCTTLISLFYTYYCMKYKMEWLSQYFELKLPLVRSIPFIHEDKELIV